MTLSATLAKSSSRAARPVLVLAAMSLGVLIAQIDTSVVSLAVKRIGADLNSGVSEMQWVIDAYNLVYASLLLTGGTLGDLYGRRRIFVLGIALFTVGTLVCALAPSGAILIGGRAISGLGAALELPMSLVLLTLAYPEEKSRAHALGIWASCNGLAFIIGPTLGGLLVDTAGWRSIFYLILPVCAAALLLTYAAVPESAEPRGRKLDLAGQALAVVALGGLAFAAIEGSHWGWASLPILSIAAVGLAAGVALFVLEGRLTGAMIPVEFFRDRVFSSALSIAALMTFGMYALLFLMPLYFQTMRGNSALWAGLQMLPLSVSFVLVSQLTGTISNAVGPRMLMTGGMACMGIGALLLAFVGADTNVWWIAIGAADRRRRAWPQHQPGQWRGRRCRAEGALGNGVGAAQHRAHDRRHHGHRHSWRAVRGICRAGGCGGRGLPRGLRAAMLVGGSAELVGAVIAFAFIRSDSLKPQAA